eukprot:CAMPEP_0181378888 /NCGR_PEP_ID=MMETSP1106-20121128/18711_1 /TAXON_ID=81844 /ORGANISM="Mantoniella antarctica, Strain SL-175" /LENGTH=518 /DNA_ID=CAMNT_0023497801 /DNA_START=121 /DNA_END=1677 /DNA_ORIENTATION=-
MAGGAKGVKSDKAANQGSGDGKRPDMNEVVAELERQRKFVTCAADENKHTAENISSGAYNAVGIDNTFSMEGFRDAFRLEVTAMDEEKVEFEMQGISPAIANAFRRILISEVPTMAIEKVFIVNNTSIVQDEVFAHRLGLVPIRADPRMFEYKSEAEAPSERNTVVFKMHVKCHREQTVDGQRGHLVNEMVYSDSLKWLPLGSELPPDEEVKFTSFTHSQEDFLKTCADEAAAAAAAAMETAPTSWVVGHRGFVVRSVEEDLYKMTCTREPSAQGHEEEAVGPASVMFDVYAGFKEPVADPQAPRIERDQSLGPAAATATEEKEEEMKEEALDPDPGPEDDDPWSGFQKNYGLAGARQSGVLGDIDGDPLDDSFTLFQKKKEEREGERSGVGMRAKRGPQQETLELNDSADPNRSVLAGVDDSHDEVLGPAMPPAPAGDRDAHKARFAGAGWASTGADDDLGFEAGGRVDYDDGDGGGSTGTDDDDDVFGNAVPTARRGGGDDDLFDAEISELDLSDS